MQERTKTRGKEADPVKAKTAEAKPEAPRGAPMMVANPEEFARNLMRMVEESGKAMAGLLERTDMSKMTPWATAQDMSGTSVMLGELWQRMLSDPAKLAEAQGDLIKGFVEIWGNTLKKAMGEDVKPVAVPEPGDNRFKDPDWTNHPYFDFWKQAYLLTSQWAEKTLADTPGLDERTRHQAEFFLKQMTSAFAPTNFPVTNPEIMRETLLSSGQNLVKGLENLNADIAKSGELLNISQTDTTAFEVGRNIAVTPGKVVFQNDVLQLIQYTPTTAKVSDVPILIVPPWINKFYILDLTPQKSFIKYAVDQGFTVFVVSWVNPDERLAKKTFEDYMKEGILAAADAVTRETGVKKPNVLGYCVGGTLLGATLAWLAGKGQDRFTSATFLTAQMDFTKAGDLKLFIDEGQLKTIEGLMAKKGYLEGSQMATVFNMLRPRDLIWPYIVNNYLLGKKPFPFDLLFWNQDSTRMPAANHTFYLREFYHLNKMAKGEMSLGGVKLDLSKVTLPIYELAAREDHIAPAKSVFIGARLFGGPVRYVMAGSGHIAGVVNPPDKVKYQHWTCDSLANTFEGWVSGAKETPGSWWPDWTKWLKDHSGAQVDARKPGAKMGVIEDAPGSYVRQKA